MKGISYMKKNIICILTLFSIFLVTGMSTTVYAKSVKGLFIYWRGETDCAKGLKKGLADLGYNLAVTEFDSERDKKKLENFLASLDETKYDFVYTFGTTASLMTAAKVKNTPVLFGIVTTPVKSGLIKSWESSGNNVTGVSHAIPYKDQVRFIQDLGSFKKVGLIYNPQEKNAMIAQKELTDILGQNGGELVSAQASKKEEIKAAVNSIIAAKPDIVYLPSDSFVQTNSGEIISPLTSSKIPTYGALEKLVKAGAMIGIVTSYEMVGKELAGKADKILKGQSPSQVPSSILPLEQQTILVNAKTVEALGIELPYDILSVAKLVE